MNGLGLGSLAIRVRREGRKASVAPSLRLQVFRRWYNESSVCLLDCGHLVPSALAFPSPRVQKKRLRATCGREEGSHKGAHGVGLLLVVELVEGAEGLPAELEITHGVIALHCLVQVGVEGHLLHVLLLTELHEALTGSITRVEDLLKQVQNQVGGAVLRIPFADVLHEVSLIDHAHTLLRALGDGLRTHTTALGSKVDALTRALGHVAGGVTHQNCPVLHAPWARVLRDGMRLDANDLATVDAHGRAITDALLVPLDALLVDDSAGAHGDVVALGEDPGVEVRGDVITHIHLGAVLVVVHLLFRNAHALLERDGVLVIPGFNVFGHPAVGAICSDNHLRWWEKGPGKLGKTSCIEGYKEGPLEETLNLIPIDNP